MNANIAKKLDAIIDQQHTLLRLVQRLTVPVDLLDTSVAAHRCGCSVRTLARLTALGVFTDGRPPEKRQTNSPLRYYADECEVYRSEGRAGVLRMREMLGRAVEEVSGGKSEQRKHKGTRRGLGNR